MTILKNRNRKKILNIIETNPELANDTDIDNNKIEKMLFTSYTMKTLRLVILIMNISYLTAVFWLMLCEFVQDFIFDIDPGSESNEDLFMITNDLEENQHMDNIILATYFAFTSLSTVGFGDYHPRGDIERIAVALILLFGVAIFSYIMSIFIDILTTIQNFKADLSYGDQLS